MLLIDQMVPSNFHKAEEREFLFLSHVRLDKSQFSLSRFLKFYVPGREFNVERDVAVKLHSEQSFPPLRETVPFIVKLRVVRVLRENCLCNYSKCFFSKNVDEVV